MEFKTPDTLSNYFDAQAVGEADRFGIAKLTAGWNRITPEEMRALILKIDDGIKRESSRMYAPTKNRLRALRNGLVNALGPEAADEFGWG